MILTVSGRRRTVAAAGTPATPRFLGLLAARRPAPRIYLTSIPLFRPPPSSLTPSHGFISLGFYDSSLHHRNQGLSESALVAGQWKCSRRAVLLFQITEDCEYTPVGRAAGKEMETLVVFLGRLNMVVSTATGYAAPRFRIGKRRAVKVLEGRATRDETGREKSRAAGRKVGQRNLGGVLN